RGSCPFFPLGQVVTVHGFDIDGLAARLAVHALDAQSEIAKGVRGMARPVMERPLPVGLRLGVELAAISAQSLYASPALGFVEPAAAKDRAGGLDAILDRKSRHDAGL